MPDPLTTLSGSLVREAEHFHRCLFAMPPDPVTLTRYEAAHQALFPSEPVSPVVSRIVERRLDVEAIEFVLRRKPAGAQLTRKLQILSYLVEVRKAYHPLFINMNARGIPALRFVFAAVLRTAWKYIKGSILIRRHGLV